MRLSHREFEALQRTILELHEYRNIDTFKREVPRAFMEMFSSEYFTYDEYEIDPIGKKARMLEYWESEERTSSQTVQLFEAQLFYHPFTKYFMEGKVLTALKLSDFMTLNQFRSSEFYEGVFGHLRVDALLCLPVVGNKGTAAICIGNRKRDFTERARLMMNLLRPHFNQARRNAELVSQALQAKPLSTFNLTPRETQIAHWVSEGKMNPEIAIILGMAVRTVEKHMERILEKLGTENRTAAAIIITNAAKDSGRL